MLFSRRAVKCDMPPSGHSWTLFTQGYSVRTCQEFFSAEEVRETVGVKVQLQCQTRRQYGEHLNKALKLGMLPWSIVMHTLVISQGRANAKLCMDCMNTTERERGRLQLCNCLKHSEMHRYDAYPSASERQRGSPKSTRWPFRVEWPDTSLDGVGHRRSDGTRMKLGGSDAKRDADTTDGPGKLSDASKRHRDAPDIRISVVTTAIAMQTINTCQDTAKLPNSPLEPEK